VWREANDARGIARSLNLIGFATWLQGSFEEARRICDEALNLFRNLGDSEGIAWSLLNLGAVAYYLGDGTRSAALCKESLTLSGDVRYKEGIAWSLDLLGNVARREGQLMRAQTMLRRSLELHRGLGDKWRVASVIEGLASTLSLQHDPERATRLLAAADSLRAEIGTPVPQVERAERDIVLSRLRSSLGEAFESTWASGYGLSWEKAVGEALESR
jgi:tetratricopeptide (TPR) repeat protein